MKVTRLDLLEARMILRRATRYEDVEKARIADNVLKDPNLLVTYAKLRKEKARLKEGIRD